MSSSEGRVRTEIDRAGFNLTNIWCFRRQSDAKHAKSCSVATVTPIDSEHELISYIFLGPKENFTVTAW